MCTYTMWCKSLTPICHWKFSPPCVSCIQKKTIWMLYISEHIHNKYIKRTIKIISNWNLSLTPLLTLKTFLYFPYLTKHCLPHIWCYITMNLYVTIFKINKHRWHQNMNISLTPPLQTWKAPYSFYIYLHFLGPIPLSCLEFQSTKLLFCPVH